MICYPSFADLNKFKQEEATEIESIGFIGCYTTRLKDGVNAVTNIRVEISMHTQIFIPVKATFLLKGIQKPGLIIEMTTEKI